MSKRTKREQRKNILKKIKDFQQKVVKKTTKTQKEEHSSKRARKNKTYPNKGPKQYKT